MKYRKKLCDQLTGLISVELLLMNLSLSGRTNSSVHLYCEHNVVLICIFVRFTWQKI